MVTITLSEDAVAEIIDIGYQELKDAERQMRELVASHGSSAAALDEEYLDSEDRRNVWHEILGAIERATG
jgi:vacuolar-type H+-ATPase subunit H